MIVIANYKRNFIFENLLNTKKYVKEKIVVIDNQSDNCDDITEFIKKNKINALAFTSDKNWEWSAWWDAYKRFPNEDRYMFIHDSMFVTQPCYLFYRGINDNTVSIFDTRNPGWHMSSYRLQNSRLSLEFLKKFKYDKADFRLVFGSMFCCNGKILKDMNSRGLMNMSANNREEAEASERLLGIYFKKFNIKVNVYNKNRQIKFSHFNKFNVNKDCPYVKFRPRRSK